MHLFCADTSRKNEESILGTASPVHYWLMIECPGTWKGNALKESELPVSVKDFLLGLYSLNLNLRIQLIQNDSTDRSHPKIFWANGDPQFSQLWELQLNQYEDLIHIDFVSLVKNGVTKNFQEITTPQFFICTNGQHDPCCAKYGLALFQASKNNHNMLWQTNHLGGDRFAANVLCLPYGIYYRRVDQAALFAMIQAHETKQLYLPTFAGRAYYSREIQTAEYFIRKDTGELAIDALQLITSTGNEDHAMIEFCDHNNTHHYVEVIKEESMIQAALSCDTDNQTTLKHYRMVAYRTST